MEGFGRTRRRCIRSGSTNLNPSRPHGKAYIPVPEFAKHCAACHTLQFDKRFGNEQVPHDKPETVHAFLLKRFGEYVAAHPGAVHEVNPPDRLLPERVRVLRVARNAAEWVQFRVTDAEWLLYAKTCKQCHMFTPTNSPLPRSCQSRTSPRAGYRMPSSIITRTA